MTSPLLSVVLSFRNEAEVIPELIERLDRALTGASIDYELIFVNDASTDASLALLEKHRASNPRVKILNMSRRFGVAPCVIAGMRHAKGDAVVYMDADLQDPPELIPTLWARWREGHDVAYTVRTDRQGESRVKLAITRAAYRLIQRASSIELPVEAGDFKLLSRRVVDHLLALDEQELYLRGLVAWVGFRQVAVPYERQPRAAGVTHFPLLASLGPVTTLLAGITSFSHAPLVLFLVLGVVFGGLSKLTLLGMLVAWLVGSPPSGAAALVAFGVLLWSTLLFGMGVIGLYLARIHRESLGRPRYIVESAIGFDER
ncbi:MAG: glycosyltransferase family 2 protein [Myxococcota bacterium]|nr:glycosyltransferase family 2 protein [Myxococcota bacterium]